MKLYNSLLTGKKTVLHFDNSGKYGRDFKEVQIKCTKGVFTAYITDGFRYEGLNCFQSLKDAISWGQTQIQKAA